MRSAWNRRKQANHWAKRDAEVRDQMRTIRRGSLISAKIMWLVLRAALIAAIIWFLHPGTMAGGASARGAAIVTASGIDGPPWTSETSGPPWT